MKNHFSQSAKDVIVVQQLRVEARPDERQLFLEEGRASAILGLIPAPERHPNVLAMVGCCLEKPPLILTYEFCPNGDLKTFLINNRGNFYSIFLTFSKKNHDYSSICFHPGNFHLFDQNNLSLRFCRDVTSGLAFLHRVKCVPRDLAARTCQIDKFYNVKVISDLLVELS